MINPKMKQFKDYDPYSGYWFCPIIKTNCVHDECVFSIGDGKCHPVELLQDIAGWCENMNRILEEHYPTQEH